MPTTKQKTRYKTEYSLSSISAQQNSQEPCLEKTVMSTVIETTNLTSLYTVFLNSRMICLICLCVLVPKYIFGTLKQTISIERMKIGLTSFR